jgi:hypothetical protein
MIVGCAVPVTAPLCHELLPRNICQIKQVPVLSHCDYEIEKVCDIAQRLCSEEVDLWESLRERKEMKHNSENINSNCFL